MRVVLDACVPRRLRLAIPGHQVTTVGEMLGTTDFDDGPLLEQLRSRCDVFVTTDRGIPEQQAISALPFAVILLRARSNRLEHLLPLVPLLTARLEELVQGQVYQIGV